MSKFMVDLTPDGIDRLIKDLEEWETGTLGPWCDDAVMYVGGSVFADMWDSIHVGSIDDQPEWDRHEAGRLKNSAKFDATGPGSYEIVVDAEDNRGKHYAMTEASRGGPHDFAMLDMPDEEFDAYIAEKARQYHEINRSNL